MSSDSAAPPAHQEDRSWKIVWTLAWPAVVLNSMQTVNALLDRFFIQSLDPAALTGVGASTTLIFFFMSISFMIGTAATALVARFFGGKDYPLMQTAAKKCLSLSFYLGWIMMALALPAAHLGARLFVPESDPLAQEMLITYFSIFAFTLPAANIILAISGSLRGTGDTKSPMVLSGIQIVLHILLNYLLIFPPRAMAWGFVMPGADMGIKGAAYAIVISSWASAIAYLIWSRRTKLALKLSIRPPNWEWITRILKIAVPSGINSLIRVTSLMMFMMVLTKVPDGSRAVAALSVGFAIESMAFMPAFGLSVSAAALVGQSLGMKDPDRANRLGWTAAHHAGAVSTVMAIALYLFAPQFAAIIVPDQPKTAEFAANFIRFIAMTETFFAYAMVLIGGMQGAGDTKRPMWLSAICLWGLRLPIAALLALGPGAEIWGLVMPIGAALGSSGCWMSMMITQLILGVAAMVMFKQGKWRTAKV